MSTANLTAKDIGSVFEEVAMLLELKGENPFRVRAYESAARLLVSQTLSVDALLKEVEAGRIKGIGSGLQEALRELATTGSYSLHAELRGSFPEGLFQLLRLPGLGPKKLKLLRDELGIDGIDSLIAACDSGRLLEVRGFSEKTQSKLKEAALRLLGNKEKMLLPAATERLTEAAAMLSQKTGILSSIAGAARRALPIIDSLELFAEYAAGSEALAASLPAEFEPVKVISAPPAAAGTGFLFATGSEAHLAALTRRAEKQKLSLRPEGLFRGAELLSSGTEEAVYRELGLAFIPPELREGRDEIEEAARLFASSDAHFPLVELKDLRGILHVHSTYSDGKNPLRELAEEVKRRGYSYLGITDHSQSAAYARGLKVPAILKQRGEIEALNEELAPFRIFQGIESDILGDGSLDYEDEVLEGFDFVIASIHSRFSLDREAMTKRLVRAVQNPYTTILGHPSGRKLLEREPYELDHEEVLRAAAESGTAVEINANPRRLDLHWEFLSTALELGVKIPICPDAHSLAGFDDLRWGIAMARKGGLRPQNIPNCLELAAFESWLRK